MPTLSYILLKWLETVLQGLLGRFFNVKDSILMETYGKCSIGTSGITLQNINCEKFNARVTHVVKKL
jgi:hypothetical protein